jgi:hypothetical protein
MVIVCYELESAPTDFACVKRPATRVQQAGKTQPKDTANGSLKNSGSDLQYAQCEFH